MCTMCSALHNTDDGLLFHVDFIFRKKCVVILCILYFLYITFRAWVGSSAMKSDSEWIPGYQDIHET